MYYNQCNKNCRICDRIIISTAVTVITVDGTDTLVIDIPTGTYFDGCKYCLVIAQAIPTTATIAMPVAISIGGDTTTVYPLTRCDCSQATACAIRTRTKYPVRVSTSAIGGVFKVLSGLSCSPDNALASLPVPATTTTTVANEELTPASAEIQVARVRTTTKKEVVTNE